MNFVEPKPAELANLRADPLVFEQELDCRPEVAHSLEKVVGFRAGRKYWRSNNGHLYALDLGDFGRGWPSMAIIYGHWARYEPRPPEKVIDEDLVAFALWMARVCDGLDPEDIQFVYDRVPLIQARAR